MLWFPLQLILVVLALLLTVRGAFRWAEAAFHSVRTPQSDRWLPLRMSNLLILLSAIYCMMTCVQHHGFGTALEMFSCIWVIVAGAALSAKGY